MTKGHPMKNISLIILMSFCSTLYGEEMNRNETCQFLEDFTAGLLAGRATGRAFGVEEQLEQAQTMMASEHETVIQLGELMLKSFNLAYQYDLSEIISNDAKFGLYIKDATSKMLITCLTMLDNEFLIAESQFFPVKDQEKFNHQITKSIDSNNIKIREDGSPEAWGISLAQFNDGSFSKMVGKLKDRGFKAYVREQDSRITVFVGPYISKDRAEEDRQSIIKKLEIMGRIVEYQAN